MMREAVFVSTARTPLTKAHRGEFNITSGPTLAALPSRSGGARRYRSRPHRGSGPRLRKSGRPPGAQYRSPGRHPRRAADHGGRQHGQPLLRLRPASDRGRGRSHRDGRAKRHRRRRCGEHLGPEAPARTRGRQRSVDRRAQACPLHGRDRHRGHRGATLWRQPRGQDRFSAQSQQRTEAHRRPAATARRSSP